MISKNRKKHLSERRKTALKNLKNLQVQQEERYTKGDTPLGRNIRDKKTQQNKKKLLKAMEKTFGVVAAACRLAKISRKTFYNYYNTDSKFKEECDECLEIAKDFVESKIYKAIQNDKERMIIYYASTKMKDRGYAKNIEVKPVGTTIPKELEGKSVEELEEMLKQYDEDEPND